VSIGIKYVLNLTLDSIYQIKSGATIFINPSLSLMPSSAFYIPTWTPSLGLSCTDCLSTEFSGYHTTHLNLNLKYGEGCIADYTTLVKVEDTEKDELFVPNVFSPKAENEENRTFKAYSNRVLRFEMSVYNRWGEKLYEGMEPYQPRDGSSEQMLICIVIAESPTVKEVKVKGTVVVLR
jgi:hypothetical protein